MKGGKLIPGREHVGRLLGWRLGGDGVGTPGLAAASHLAVADDVASLATVGTEVLLLAATSLLRVEGSAVATAAIDLHGARVLAGGRVWGLGEGLAAGVGV